MDRRSFFQTGTTSLIGGWLLAKAPAVAKGALRSRHSIQEWDEDWGDIRVHVIEMTLPFDDPVVFFQRDGRRLLVPRQDEGEIRHEQTETENLTAILRKRLQAMRELFTAGKYEKDLRRDGPDRPTDTCRALHLVAHCPSRTEYGLVYGFDRLTKDTMQITVPARFLFGGDDS